MFLCNACTSYLCFNKCLASYARDKHKRAHKFFMRNARNFRPISTKIRNYAQILIKLLNIKNYENPTIQNCFRRKQTGRQTHVVIITSALRNIFISNAGICYWKKILSHISVTKDGVRIGNWIY
jgi:hypothetical protein